jgi:hypothetical protein
MTSRRVLQSIADMKARLKFAAVRCAHFSNTVSTPFPLWAWECMVLPPDWSRLIGGEPEETVMPAPFPGRHFGEQEERRAKVAPTGEPTERSTPRRD